MRCQQVKQAKKLQWIVLLCFAILAMPLFCSAEQQTSNWLDMPVTLSFRNEPLNKVLDEIGRQAHLSVVYDKAFASEPVMGIYQNVKASEAIARLFKGKNIILQVNDAKKVIVVKTFGTTHLIATGGQATPSAITLKELNALNNQQYQEYKKSITDQNKIIDGGMTLAKLNALHEQQYNDYRASIANNDEVMEDQVNTMNELQYAAFKATLTDKNQVLSGGMTRAQLDAMHDRQYAEFKNNSTNNW